MISKDAKARYLKGGGNHCPYCESGDIESGPIDYGNLLSAMPENRQCRIFAKSLNIKAHAKGESLDAVLNMMKERGLIKLERNHWVLPNSQRWVAGIIMGYKIHCETHDGEILFTEDWYRTDPVESYGLRVVGGR